MPERELTTELRHRSSSAACDDDHPRRHPHAVLRVLVRVLLLPRLHRASPRRPSTQTCRPFDPKVATPANTTVNVYNATTRSGLAARTAADLGGAASPSARSPTTRWVARCRPRRGAVRTRGQARSAPGRPPRRQGHDAARRQAQGRHRRPRPRRQVHRPRRRPEAHGHADVSVAEHLPVGHRLGGLTVPNPSPIVLSRDMSTTQALDVIVRACGQQVLDRVDPVLTTRDARSLHEMRVALRRLRAAFSLLRRPLGDDEKLAWVSTETRDLAAPLGRARDLDVALRDHPEHLRGSPHRSCWGCARAHTTRSSRSSARTGGATSAPTSTGCSGASTTRSRSTRR